MERYIRIGTIRLALAAGAFTISIGCGDRTAPTAPTLGDQAALAAGGGGGSGGGGSIVKSMVGLEPLFDAAANVSFALKVSDVGQVVGTSNSNSSNYLQAVIWEGSTFAYPLGPAGSVSSSASGITPDGSVIVGHVGETAVRWVKVNGVWTELALPGQGVGVDLCFAVDIARDGTIAGTCNFGKGPSNVVVWRNGILTDLGPGSAIAVNASQQVLVRVGNEPFIWDLRTNPMTVTPFGTLGGTVTIANDINDFGQVVGASQNSTGVFRPFLWTAKKGMVDLGTIGGDRGAASAINNSGQIVGLSDLPGTTVGHATYWYKGKIHDLGVLSGYESSSATDINASGQIVGGSGSGSNHRATLWTLAAK
jgi:probable HAF family extracellular repeat protein